MIVFVGLTKGRVANSIMIMEEGYVNRRTAGIERKQEKMATTPEGRGGKKT